jgi:hypothetical protein
MPPVRPTDLYAINALASPPAASAPMDPSIAARVAASSSPSPQSVSMDPSIAARVSAANPATYSPNAPSPAFPTAPARPFPPPPPPAVPASLAAVNAAATEAGLADPTGGWQPPGRPDPWMAGATPAYAADPGAAQRAALYRQLNPTGTPIGVPPSAMANPPSTRLLPLPLRLGSLRPLIGSSPLTSSPPRAGGRALPWSPMPRVLFQPTTARRQGQVFSMISFRRSSRQAPGNRRMPPRCPPRA